MKYTVFLGYRFEREWFTRTREERKKFEAEHVTPLFAKYAGKLDMRFYSAAAFTTQFTNFVLIETEELKHYYFLIEELRDSPLLAQGLATITDIFTGIEDGFPQFEREMLGTGN